VHKISLDLGRIMSGFGSTTSINISLGRSWDDIVGEDLKDMIVFVEVRFVGEGQLKVYAKVVGSAILFVLGRKHEIVQSIKILSSVRDVSLILRPTHLARKELHAA
jgi:hypothetical protein